MKPDFKVHTMVRGYVIYSQFAIKDISLEKAKARDYSEFGVAYTFWHFLDDSDNSICNELNELLECIKNFGHYEGIVFGFEVKDSSDFSYSRIF